MEWFLHISGLALIYGAAGTVVVLLVMRLLKHDGSRWIPLLFSTLTFVALTQHPLPDRVGMICPINSAAPQLVPFGFMKTFVHLYRYDASALDWVTNQTIVAAVMNVVLCAVIGAALAPHVAKRRWMLAFGVGLTLLVETTQLTGAWGLYPCAWRKFDIDDTIMNVFGVAAGWVWMRRKRHAMLS